MSRQEESPAFKTTITPVCPKDQWKPIHNIRSLVFILVREVLDDALMRDSLDSLIRNHLQILGARIKPRGKREILEYHLPKPFPEDYALFSWSTRDVPSSIQETGLIPNEDAEAKKCISFLPAVTVYESNWAPREWPVERKFDKPDTPLLLVHLTRYTNATVVGMNLPHCVADIIGFGSVIKAWIQVMKGEEPTPFLEVGTNELRGSTDLPAKELRRKGTYRLKNKKEGAQILLGFIPEFVGSPKETRHTIFLPAELIQGLRDRHNEDLKAKYGPDTPSLSNGDILVSIMAKLANIHHKSPRKQMLTGPANLRGFHPALPKGQPYLHNALAFYVARLAISHDTPMTEIAYRHRLAVNEAIKPENIERNLAVTRELFQRRIGMHICEPFEFSYSTTNWCNAWHGVDFSPAIAEEEKRKLPCPAPIVFGHSAERSIPLRCSGVIMSKAEGGYWIDFAQSTKAAAIAEALVKDDPMLETW